jgi:hypothetical protein
MARISVERIIRADPTSTALLLAGPSAMDLWPGVQRRVDSPDGRAVVVDANVPTWGAHATPAEAVVRARPPRRTPTAYVSEFSFSGPGLPDTTGVLTLIYEPAGDMLHATSALLSLEFRALDGDGKVLDRVRAARALRGLAAGFLDNLATAAEQRSYAA